MKVGDMVLIKLTGQIGMVLEVIDSSNKGYKTGYLVRTPDYKVVKMYSFELQKRV